MNENDPDPIPDQPKGEEARPDPAPGSQPDAPAPTPEAPPEQAAPAATRPIATAPQRQRRPRRPSFSVGSCFSQTVSIWFRNLVPFTILTAIVMSPYFAWMIWGHTPPEPEVTASFESAVDVILPTFLGYVVTSTLVYGVYQQLRGKPASFAESVSRGLRSLPSVLGVALIIGAILIVIYAPVFLIMTVSPVLGGLATVASAVLMMILFMGLAVVIPVCIFEDKGGTAALGRSWSLTGGYKFQIFLFMILLGILQGVAMGVLGGCAGVLTYDGPQSVDRTVLIVTVLLQVPFTSMQSVASSVIYHDLRLSKEGIDTAELAAIFD